MKIMEGHMEKTEINNLEATLVLCMSGTRPLPLGKYQRREKFNNNVMRRIFGPELHE
jgi:hypothetical protein